MNTITLNLTEAEAQSLINLMDLAVKAGGLQAASIALPLVQKLQEAAQPKKDD